MSVLHPDIRIPTWVAVAVVAAAYVVRAVFVRGGDFRPDLPIDAIVLAVLVVLLILRWALTRAGWDRRDVDGPDDRPADDRPPTRSDGPTP